MSTSALSSAQFGTSESSAPTPQPIRMEPTTAPSGGGPLPYNSNTNNSAKQAAAWRKPAEVLPYSTATDSSIFTPYAQG